MLIVKKSACIFIILLFVAQSGHALSKKTVYVATPTLCTKVEKVSGGMVYLTREAGPCVPGVGKVSVEIDEDTTELDLFVDGKFWKKSSAGQVAVSDIPDIIQNARKHWENYSVPENTNTAEASKRADDLYAYYQSEEFQKKVESEKDRLQTEVYGAQAKNYYKDDKSSGTPGKLSSQERLYLFISSSVPKETLRRYTETVGRLRDPNVKIVMRGFINGAKYVKPTMAFIRDILLIDPGCNPLKEKCSTFNTEVIIDPMLFSKYDIQKVPAFVYVPVVTVVDPEKSEGWESNIKVSNYYSVYGDVNLDHVLEMFQKETKSKGIDALLSALREGFYR